MSPPAGNVWDHSNYGSNYIRECSGFPFIENWGSIHTRSIHVSGLTQRIGEKNGTTWMWLDSVSPVWRGQGLQ